jgi:arylsulfatase A-like enzyme
MRTRSPQRQKMGMMLVVMLCASGMLLLWKGLGSGARVEAPREASAPLPGPASTSPAGPPVSGPAGAPGGVHPGTGVYTADVPAGPTQTDGGALCAGCDVVLITVCSLRKDYLGAYGFPADISPSVDAMANKAFRFNRAYSASNFTLASLTAILTGRYGSATGVTGWDKGLTTDVPTLPEVLGLYGYRTGGFTTDAPSGFRPDYGLDRGFQHLEIIAAPRNSPDGRYRGNVLEPAGSVADTPLSWLADQPTDEPVFLMMHTRTAHFPFVVQPPGEGEDPTGVRQMLWEAGQVEAQARQQQAMPGMAGGTEQEGIVEIAREDPLQTLVNRLGEPAEDVWRETYAEAVSLMDADVHALLAGVKTRGRPTIVILVADHGESLNDHGELLHGDAFFDGVINVPLIISVPGMKGPSELIQEVVSQTDILPTLLDLVGAVQPAGIDGASLVPLMKGDENVEPRVVLSEGGVARQIGSDLPGAVITDPWILLKQRRGCGNSPQSGPRVMSGTMQVCLYNADTDPGQIQEQAHANPEVVADLLGRWDGFRAAHGRKGEARDLSPAFVEELRKSGYDFSKGVP